jgi:hypothetical protein
MTILAYSNGQLSADTRTLLKPAIPGFNKLSKEDHDVIKDFIGNDSWTLSSNLSVFSDGECKIVVPKRCYFKGHRVKAVGVSGSLENATLVAKVKAGTELFTHESFMVANKGWYLIQTEDAVFTIRSYDWAMSQPLHGVGKLQIAEYPLTTMVTVGSGELLQINGRYYNPVGGGQRGFTAPELITMGCAMAYSCGGQIDTYDPTTGVVIRSNLDTSPVELISRFYQYAANTPIAL